LVTVSDASAGLAERLRRHYGLSRRFAAIGVPSIAARPSVCGFIGAAHARLHRAQLVYTRAPHAGLTAASMGLPVIFEMHADETAFSDRGRAALHALAGHPALCGVVTISRPLRAHLQSLFPASTIMVAHDGADARVRGPSPNNQRFRAGYVGHLYKGRGIELLLQLAALHPDMDFEIVGGTPQDLAYWRDQAASHNVIFSGSVPHADVAAKLGTFDIVLAPYQKAVFSADGATDTARWMSPLKLFEYMAAAKAILASDLPAIREILTDRVTALLRAPEDVAGWSNALSVLHRNAALRRRLEDAAYADLNAHYTWEQRAKTILSAFATPNANSRAA
jgi:glycosyltransferase involved in cell wall biosynthesis